MLQRNASVSPLDPCEAKRTPTTGGLWEETDQLLSCTSAELCGIECHCGQGLAISHCPGACWGLPFITPYPGGVWDLTCHLLLQVRSKLFATATCHERPQSSFLHNSALELNSQAISQLAMKILKLSLCKHCRPQYSSFDPTPGP